VLFFAFTKTASLPTIPFRKQFFRYVSQGVQNIAEGKEKKAVTAKNIS
jgi:hypothetical protein